MDNNRACYFETIRAAVLKIGDDTGGLSRTDVISCLMRHRSLLWQGLLLVIVPPSAGSDFLFARIKKIGAPNRLR